MATTDHDHVIFLGVCEHGYGLGDENEATVLPTDFCFANLMELCERAAYSGCFIVLILFLSRVAAF